MKRFSTVRDTQRSSQSYMKKRRGRREIKMSRGKRELKRRETDLRSFLFPEWFRTYLEHPRAGTACSAGHAPELVWEEKGKEEIEVF